MSALVVPQDAVAAELRRQGLRVTVYPEADKLGKQLKYADSIGVAYTCIAGDEEIAGKLVRLKRMTDGQETKAKAGDIAGIINKNK